MNYLEVCGVILHVSTAFCLLVIVFGIRNATNYKEAQDTIYEKKARQKRPIDLETMLDGQAEAARKGWEDDAKDSVITYRDLERFDGAIF